MKRSHLRPSPAMVVACLALFVALGSGAYAAVKLKPNSVKAKNIKNGAVTEPKIAGGAVTTAKLGAEAVTKDKLAAGAVTKAKFAATGTATNTTALNLGGGACTVATFAAPGVRADDVIAFSFREAPGAVGSLLVARPAENTASTDTLSVQVCEQNGIATGALAIGSLKLDFVAIR